MKVGDLVRKKHPGCSDPQVYIVRHVTPNENWVCLWNDPESRKGADTYHIPKNLELINESG